MSFSFGTPKPPFFNNETDTDMNVAEEFIAALEASTGKTPDVRWPKQMGRTDLHQAFDLLLNTQRPHRGLDVLVRSGVMKAVLPEVAALVNFGEGIKHKDVWLHTQQVIRQSPRRSVVRWAAFLHDIGKVPTRRFDPGGKVTFIGHPEVGARMFDKISRRIAFSKSDRTRIRFLIASHLRASSYKETWTDSAVRRFAKDVGDSFHDLLDLSRADITSKYEEKVKRGLRQIDLLAAHVEAVLTEDAKPKPLPKGLGTEIVAGLGIQPGPALGDLMKFLRDEVNAGRLKAQAEFPYYIDYLKQKTNVVG